MPRSTARTGLGITMTGGFLANVTQPLVADNIIMLHDGSCASVCVLTAEMLCVHSGIPSIAMGRRPVAGKIQGVDTKGSQTLAIASVYNR